MPILLTGFKDGEKSLERAAALGAENIVLPHWGMISGAENCRRYFEKTAYEFEWMKTNIIRWHGEGMSNEDIMEEIREKYHTGHVGEVYPLKAFYLNTGYTVSLIIKEFCGD